MSDVQFTCPHCTQTLEVPEDALGQTVLCPACQGQITLAKPAPVLRIARMVAPESAPPPVPNVSGPDADIPKSPPRATYPLDSLFLYIPVSRLVFMSILSCGFYEFYWIYKNWRYMKERYNLNIRPFWRGVYGFFYGAPLIGHIHADQEARSFQMPSFSLWLGSGYFLLGCIEIGLSCNSATSIIVPFIPSFLLFIPVQKYINAVSERRNPEQAFYRWSSGQVVCLVFGLLVWCHVLLSGNAALSGDKSQNANSATQSSPQSEATDFDAHAMIEAVTKLVPDFPKLNMDPRFPAFLDKNPALDARRPSDPKNAANWILICDKFRQAYGIAKPASPSAAKWKAGDAIPGSWGDDEPSLHGSTISDPVAPSPTTQQRKPLKKMSAAPIPGGWGDNDEPAAPAK